MFNFRFKDENDKWSYIKRTYEYKVIGSSIKLIKALKNEEYLLIPDGITEIGDFCFSSCKRLKEIKIPDSVIKIGHAAFLNCIQLREVYIGSNVKEIGQMAFLNSYGNRSIFKIVNKSNVDKAGMDELKDSCYMYLKEEKDEYYITTSDEGYTIGIAEDKTLLYNVPINKIVDGLFILDKITLDGKQLNNIIIRSLDSLKKNCNSIIITADVKQLVGTFTNSKVRRIMLPESIESISEDTFYGCSDLDYVRLPKGFKADDLFISKKLGNFISIPDGTKEIRKDFFTEGYNVKRIIKIPKSISNIDGDAFNNLFNVEIEYEYDGSIIDFLNISKINSDFMDTSIIRCKNGIINKGKVEYDYGI